MMDFEGTLKGIARDLVTGNWQVTFETKNLPSREEFGGGTLDVTAKAHRNRRSRNANSLLWECLGRIGKSLNTDKWEVYLHMLKRYGEYTYVCVKPKAVEMLKRQWRECEELGPIDINGQVAVQMLCYYGSSTYDTKQFSVLLDGVISEMKEMGIDAPTDEQMKQALEVWERERKKQSM